MSIEAADRPSGQLRTDQLPRQMVATWPTIVVKDASPGNLDNKAIRRAAAKERHGWNSGNGFGFSTAELMGKVWPTPTAGDLFAPLPNNGSTPNGSSVTTEKRGAPNPEFAFWLMGFPDVWIYGALLAMQLYRRAAALAIEAIRETLDEGVTA